MGYFQIKSSLRIRPRPFALMLAIASGALVSCGDCSDETATADQFIGNPVNLACQSDDDCVVVTTGCADVSRGLCGQAQLSGAAAASQAWKGLSQELEDCAPDSCSICLAALLPSCRSGFCGGAP
jgi:hypothetical protein